MAYSLTVTAQGMLEAPQPPAEAVNWPDFGPLRWAICKVTLDTTSYTTGGLALNVLGALTGWSGIAHAKGDKFLQGATVSYSQLVDPNNATTGNRKLKLLAVANDAEHAASATTAQVFNLYVLGW